MQWTGRRSLGVVAMVGKHVEPFGHVRKMELFDTIVRKKKLVVPMVGRYGAF